jgi:hypothetical protein
LWLECCKKEDLRGRSLVVGQGEAWKLETIEAIGEEIAHRFGGE